MSAVHERRPLEATAARRALRQERGHSTAADLQGGALHDARRARDRVALHVRRPA